MKQKDNLDFSSSKLHEFLIGFRIQMRVIGALILRELHTRYGRENIGYLWIILEPMLFATGIGIIHAGSASSEFAFTDITSVPFAIVGYGTFIIFRNTVNRSGGTIESNAPLLYHRMVSLFDMLLARTLLETAGIMCSVFILVCLSYCMGLGHLPVRPIYILLGQIYMFWLSFAISTIVCAATYENATVERLVHPATYFMMPISAIFFMLEWVPNPYRQWFEYVPMAQCIEMARYGQFESASNQYFSFSYLSLFCAISTVIGLLSLRAVRRHITLN